MSQYLTGLNLLDPAVKRYNGGTSTFTMDNNGTTNGTLLWVSGVAQIPGTDYNVSGATITTTTAAPAGTNTVVSLQLFETGTVNTLAANTVTEAQFATALHTIWVPASGMRPTSSNGCALITDVETTSGRPDMQVLDFDASSDEHAQFGISFPKSWNEGTITASFYWCSTATDTDGVSWGIQGVATSDSDTIDVAYGTAIVVDDANISAAEDCYVSATSTAVTIAGSPAAGDLTFFRVFRDVSDANDTAAEDARLIGVKIFFTTDSGGDT